MNKYSQLFSPLRVGNLTLRNRIMTGPMSIVELDAKEGLTERAISYYESLAAGGAAVVTLGESIIPTDCGKTHEQQIMLGRDEVRFSLKKLTDAIHAHGAYANVEISHGGAMADPKYNDGRNSIGATGCIDEWGDEIIQMDTVMMDQVADAFADAVETVRDCGFDIAQIHYGHGWLLSQFLSPLYNRRTDEFGGSRENRARFPLMVARRIRERVGHTIALDMRISGSEFLEGGAEIDDCVYFCSRMAEEGLTDMMNISAGAPWTTRMAISSFEERGINSEFSYAVKQAVKNIPVSSVGGYTDPELMERFLAEGRADAFVLGRSILADPQLPEKARTGHPEQIHQCIRCFICNETQYHSCRTLECSINPLAGREWEAKMFPPPSPRRKVLIAGGGPGGMEAAITAARRGHDVTLYEARSELGGALTFARHVPFKEDLAKYIDSLQAELETTDVKMLLNTTLTPEEIAREKPDAVICAVGAEPVIPPIAGIDGDNVVLGARLYDDGGAAVGRRVVVIGGGLIGCESALHLAQEGHEVTVLEMRDEVLIDCTHDHRRFMMPRLEAAAKLCCGLSVNAVTPDGVTAKDREGNERFFPADTVICAAGLKARVAEVEKLRSAEYDFWVIGDAKRARKVHEAVREGFDAATFLR